MKHKKRSQDQNQKSKPAVVSTPAALAVPNKNGIEFLPAADEVARRAYFSYVNEGSPQGRNVQHWFTTVRVLKEVNAEMSNVYRPLVQVGWCERLEVFMRFSLSSSSAKLAGCMPENLFSPNSPI